LERGGERAKMGEGVWGRGSPSFTVTSKTGIAKRNKKKELPNAQDVTPALTKRSRAGHPPASRLSLPVNTSVPKIPETPSPQLLLYLFDFSPKKKNQLGERATEKNVPGRRQLRISTARAITAIRSAQKRSAEGEGEKRRGTTEEEGACIAP
jgi:hypothetical protein